MLIRRGIIVLLAIALIAALAYGFLGIKELPDEMNPVNLTIVKAPDQTEPTIHPDFVKEEYVSVLPEGKNIAPEGKIEASSFTQTYTPRKAIDGNTKGVSYWEGKAGSYPNTLTVDLKKSASIHAVRVALCPLSIWSKRTQTFSVKISSDGQSFEDLVPSTQYTFDPDKGNEAIIEFDPTEAQFVQLEFTENTGAMGGQVAEFEIYSKQ